MSSQERIENNIRELSQTIASIDAEIEKLESQLKKEGLSKREINELKNDIYELKVDREDISADIAILQEMLDKLYMDEDNHSDYGDSGGGLDWNESGYFD